MRILIIGDLHLEERAVKEIDEIFEKDILPMSADKFIQLGDWFDSNRPTPLVLKYSAELVLKLKKRYREVIILSGTGQHDMMKNTSAIEHLASLGVDTIKGDLTYNDILYGHFMLHESKLEYGSGKFGIKDLEKYKYVFLGHQHNPQDITTNIFHIGSIRHVNFNEVNDQKRIALLEDDNLSFIQLKSCIPMRDINNVTELETVPSRTKVRFICTSFQQYRENASKLNKIGKRFIEFKIKLDFKSEVLNEINVSQIKTISISKDEIIKSYLDKIEDKDVMNLLKEIINDQ